VNERISEMQLEVQVNQTPLYYWSVETTFYASEEGTQQAEPRLTCLSTSYGGLQS